METEILRFRVRRNEGTHIGDDSLGLTFVICKMEELDWLISKVPSLSSNIIDLSKWCVIKYLLNIYKQHGTNACVYVWVWVYAYVKV